MKIERKNFSFKKGALIIALVTLCAIIFVSCILHTKKLTKKEQNISLNLDNDMTMATKDGFDGSVLVASKGKILLSKGYGMADRENKVLCTEQTRFMIGSLTKQFTSMAIMQLEEKGLLSVNDNVERYIPSFPYGKEITIHQLLSHTSGLRRDLGTDIKFDVPPSSIQEALNLVVKKGFTLISPPGETFNYSNTGYELLGLIIEKVSGKTYEEYVQKNIFKPLGMVNSGFGYNRNTNVKLAKGYDASEKPVIKEAYVDYSIWPFSAGEIYSTIGDLYKWDKALYTEKLASIKTLNKIFTPVLNHYGYGWGIVTPGYKGSNGHEGSVYGFTSDEMRQGENDSFYIILSNKDCTNLPSMIQTLAEDVSK